MQREIQFDTTTGSWPVPSGLRGMLLARIKSLSTEAAQILQAADHYFQAGQSDRAIHANTDAQAHFQAALALGYPKKAEILVELGDLHTLNGNYPLAIQQYETAAAFNLSDLLPVIEQKIGQVYLRRGQWEQAACHFEDALIGIPADTHDEQKAFEARYAPTGAWPATGQENPPRPPIWRKPHLNWLKRAAKDWRWLRCTIFSIFWLVRRKILTKPCSIWTIAWLLPESSPIPCHKSPPQQSGAGPG